MNRLIRTVLAIAVAVNAAACSSQLAAQDLTKWDDQKLRQALESVQPGREDEAQLLEIVRRGGEEWTKLLIARNKAFLESKKQRKKADDIESWNMCNLNLVTALRRLQKQPDPLRILIVGKRHQDFTVHQKIRFVAVVVNLDEQQETIPGLTKGGHYRSGRLERYRFEIRNEKGETLTGTDFVAFDGGGISTWEDLQHGESWQVELPLQKYVNVSKPGKYKLRVHYHNNQAIADRDSIAGLMTVQSDEIELEIDPIRVHATEEQRKQARKWIAELPEEGPVKILLGIVEAPMQLSPSSPAGELQRMFTDAVPDLVDAALDPKLSTGKRAWVLGILTGITGHNNPSDGFLRGPEILGAYEIHTLNGQGSGSGRIDEAKQKEFAEKWRPWKTDGYFKFAK